jgi:hypothetical protein
MDKRVAQHYKGDLSKANIVPEKREALIEKYKHLMKNETEQSE